MKAFIGTLRRQELSRALVVTLTYPAEFPAPNDHDVYKGHLHTLQIYLRRKWPGCSGVWKLEFQTRGAAHYHLLLFGLHDVELEIVRAWIRETWYRIAHNGDKHKGVAGTQVDRIKSVGGAVSYLAKYINKGDQTMPGNFSGRYWGKINAINLPMVKPETLELDEKTGNQLLRIARKKIQKDVENSRWKRFLKGAGKQFWRMGGRLFWDAVKSAKHGTKPKFDQDGERKVPRLRWMAKDGGKIEVDGVNYFMPFEYRMQLVFVDIIRPDIRRLPKRWKPWNNDRVRIMCNASDFVERILRAQSSGGSFLAWSRSAEERA